MSSVSQVMLERLFRPFAGDSVYNVRRSCRLSFCKFCKCHTQGLLRGALAHWDMSLKEAFDLLPKTTSKGDNFGFGAKVGRWRRERKAPR